MPNSNLFQTLLTAAEVYLSLGYSVIPIWGMADPTHPKAAGVAWATFQRRRATPSEVREWFSEPHFGGIAIVTGSISRLVVLDFDTEDGYKKFRTQHPDLAETHVIQTRRGYHIYFHVPPHLSLPSRKGQGIDLLSDGRYVVARPTCIDGHTYKLIRGGQPKTLTANDVEQIIHFVDGQESVLPFPAAQREFTRSSFDADSIQPMDKTQAILQTDSDLQQTYLRKIRQGRGRNDALFQTGLEARDDGWILEWTFAALANLHVWQPASGPHRTETPAVRYQEARRTVESAFSRPPRRFNLPTPEEEKQLPNRVREKLFGLGETRTVRVLEGLRLKGTKPGNLFTIKQALELLKGIVGRDSVYAALKAVTPSGELIFSRQNPSPLNPLIPANAATDTNTDTTQCLIGRAKKSGKSPNHRPATVYLMPTNEALCSGLGVQPSHSDPFTLVDLATAKQTRQAAHRELIRRRPGHYPRRWLAKRLGVSRKTLDTYNNEIKGLHWQPCFWEQRVYWSNLSTVPDGVEVEGAFLEDETKKRFPARRSIAARLLGQGKRISYKRQDVNYYWHGENKPILPMIAPVQQAHKPYQPPKVPQPVLSSRRTYSVPGSSPTQPGAATTPQISPFPSEQPASKTQTARPTKWSQRSLRKPLKNSEQEQTAQQIYTVVNALTTDPAARISQSTSRKWVLTYDASLIASALKVIQTRHNIRSPAAFLATLLRSESKAQWWQA